MTCERASELITELVCGELDAAGEASVRDHAKGCPTCGPELEKFARVLRVAESIALDEPSPQVDVRIMQAAREAASRKGGSAEAIDSDSPVSGFRAWLDRLSTWAMSPQVAMASVLLLVVGIGLYALPFSQQPSTSGMLPISQEPEGEQAPAPAASAATAAPSEPSPAEMADKAASNVVAQEAMRRRLEGPDPAEGAAASPLAAKRSAGTKEAAPARSARRPAAKANAFARGDAEDRAREFGGGVGSAAGMGAAKGGPYAPPPPADEPARAREKSPAKPVAARPELFDEAEASPARPSGVVQAAPVPAELDSVASGKAAPAKELEKKSESASGPDFGQMLDEGLSAARSGQYARAVELLEPVANKAPAAQRASARPMLARSLRALGLCARALPYYATLVQATTVSEATLLEAADCYDRTGNAPAADELRKRAQAAKK
jgi:hypothetical protein